MSIAPVNVFGEVADHLLDWCDIEVQIYGGIHYFFESSSEHFLSKLCTNIHSREGTKHVDCDQPSV